MKRVPSMNAIMLEHPSSPAELSAPGRSATGRTRVPGRTGSGKARPARDAPRPASRPDPHAMVRSLYSEHGPALLTYVTRLLSDRHQAEDVVQETMLRAWRNADLLTPDRGSVSGWLARVAHNIAVDKIRARKARPAEVEETAAAPDIVEDHAAHVVNSVDLAKALALLTPAHRDVLCQVYFADRTAVQTAQVLGLPVGTVKSRNYHALRRLKTHLEEIERVRRQ